MRGKASWFVVATGIGTVFTGPPQLMIGGSLSYGLGLHFFLISVALYGLVLTLLTFFYGGLGQRVNGASSAVMNEVLGIKVTKFVFSMLMTTIVISWFSIISSVGAGTLTNIFKLPFHISVVIFTSITASIAYHGLKNLSRIGRFTIPFTLAFAAWLTWHVLIVSGGLKALSPSTTMKFSVLEAAGLALSGVISILTVSPDFFKEANSSAHVLYATLLGVVAPSTSMIVMGGLMGYVTGTYNPAIALTNLNMAIHANVLLFISALGNASTALYPPSLALSNALGLRQKKAVILSYCVGLALALTGILGAFIEFLRLLGVVLPSLIGASLAHYYLSDKRLARKVSCNWIGVTSWAAGAMVGAVPAGSPPINALIAGLATYLSLHKLPRGSMLRAKC